MFPQSQSAIAIMIAVKIFIQRVSFQELMVPVSGGAFQAVVSLEASWAFQ
jgi:hypothetical protein